MKNKKSKFTSLFLRELKEYFYQPKHERNGFILFEMGLMAILANRMDMRNEFLFFMLVVVPFIFFITSIFIYRDKKRDIEKIKNYVDDEDEWEDDGLPF